MGRVPEKLLTLEEAAARLGLSRQEVESLIGKGRLSVFRLGGVLLRVRQEEVERLSSSQPAAAEISPVPRLSRPSAGERIADFFYFNDFYILALLVVLTLLAVIILF